LRSHLQLQRKFSAQAAENLIASLKQTLSVVPPEGMLSTETTTPQPEAKPEVPFTDLLLPREQPRPTIAAPVELQVWGLGDGVKAELRISGGKLGPRHIKKLRGYMDVFLSDPEDGTDRGSEPEPAK
jgi:hypothetical protein